MRALTAFTNLILQGDVDSTPISETSLLRGHPHPTAEEGGGDTSDCGRADTPPSELFTFVHSAYEQPSLLFCGDHIVESAEGVQQGDPLGPLLFCLAIQPLVLKLQSEFSVFYLDDGTIGGCVEDVIHDLQLVEEGAGRAGLQLNRRKTELICDDPSACDAVLCAVSELQVITCGQATLLGTPIGSVGLIDTTISSKIEKLKLMGGRLYTTSIQPRCPFTPT